MYVEHTGNGGKYHQKKKTEKLAKTDATEPEMMGFVYRVQTCAKNKMKTQGGE